MSEKQGNFTVFRAALVLAAALTTPASATLDPIQSATVSATCDSYTFTVEATELGVTDHWVINYTIVLTPTSGAPLLVTGEIPVVPDDNSNFTATVTNQLPPLAGSFTLSGTTTLLAVFDNDAIEWSTKDIEFSPSTLQCQPPPPPCSTVIGDRVWYDANLNGIQDMDASRSFAEPGVPGVEVRLRRAGETSVFQTTLTDGGGYYVFTVPCGSYEVEIAPPSGLGPTTVNAPGSTQANDSNANPSSATPPNNGEDLTVDFGLVNVQDLCPPAGTTGLPNPVGTLFWGVDALGDVYFRYDQSPGLNDNSYGANIVQWPRSHNFGDLVGSDKAEFIFKNAAGNVVLDFFLDYVSAKSGTPSGYASLGLGADGGLNTGQAAWILGWNTSLARNLNAFCVAGNCSLGGTNLLQNSPPTVSPNDYTLPSVSAYVGWNFTNSYEGKISHLAFGGSSFGSVAVGLVHNSPPKIGSNAVAPIVCDGQPAQCSVSAGAVTFKDKQLKWPLTNSGSSAQTISQIDLVWPSRNGRLIRIKSGKDVIWDAKAAWNGAGITILSSSLTADPKKKRIDAGRTKTFVLEFEKNASNDPSQYSLTISFASGCQIVLR